MALVTVWATEKQWEEVRRLALLGEPWSEPVMGKRAGFTKDQWRDFYGRLRAAGLLVPKGNGAKAGYTPSRALVEALRERPWVQD